MKKVLPRLDAEVALRRLTSDKKFVYLERQITPREQLAINNLGIPGIDFRPTQQAARSSCPRTQARPLSPDQRSRADYEDTSSDSPRRIESARGQSRDQRYHAYSPRTEDHYHRCADQLRAADSNQVSRAKGHCLHHELDVAGHQRNCGAPDHSTYQRPAASKPTASRRRSQAGGAGTEKDFPSDRTQVRRRCRGKHQAPRTVGRRIACRTQGRLGLPRCRSMLARLGWRHHRAPAASTAASECDLPIAGRQARVVTGLLIDSPVVRR